MRGVDLTRPILSDMPMLAKRAARWLARMGFNRVSDGGT